MVQTRGNLAWHRCYIRISCSKGGFSCVDPLYPLNLLPRFPIIDFLFLPVICAFSCGLVALWCHSMSFVAENLRVLRDEAISMTSLASTEIHRSSYNAG